MAVRTWQGHQAVDGRLARPLGGNTLVVDVANNNVRRGCRLSAGSIPMRSISWSAGRPRADHIVYIATIDDSKVYSRPWKLRVDYRRQKVDEQWESAVWEGNRTADVS
jgi:hypothetical protein